MGRENLWYAGIRIASRRPLLHDLSPLDDELEPVSAALDELLGLVVRQVEDVRAVDLDQVVVRPAASLSGHAVQRDLESREIARPSLILQCSAESRALGCVNACRQGQAEA